SRDWSSDVCSSDLVRDADRRCTNTRFRLSRTSAPTHVGSRMPAKGTGDRRRVTGTPENVRDLSTGFRGRGETAHSCDHWDSGDSCVHESPGTDAAPATVQ